MNWIILAIIAPIFFVSAQALAKLLPKDVSIYLITAYGLFIGAIIMLCFHLFSFTNKQITLSSKSLLIAVGMGVCLSFGNFFVFKAFSIGAQQTIFSSIFNPVYIIYAVLFGLLIWHEKLNFTQVAGILLSIVGIILVVYFQKA